MHFVLFQIQFFRCSLLSNSKTRLVEVPQRLPTRKYNLAPFSYIFVTGYFMYDVMSFNIFLFIYNILCRLNANSVSRNGTCYTSTECRDRAGTAHGSCAAG